MIQFLGWCPCCHKTHSCRPLAATVRDTKYCIPYSQIPSYSLPADKSHQSHRDHRSSPRLRSTPGSRRHSAQSGMAGGMPLGLLFLLCSHPGDHTSLEALALARCRPLGEGQTPTRRSRTSLGSSHCQLCYTGSTSDSCRGMLGTSLHRWCRNCRCY